MAIRVPPVSAARRTHVIADSGEQSQILNSQTTEIVPKAPRRNDRLPVFDGDEFDQEVQREYADIGMTAKSGASLTADTLPSVDSAVPFALDFDAAERLGMSQCGLPYEERGLVHIPAAVGGSINILLMTLPVAVRGSSSRNVMSRGTQKRLSRFRM